MRPLHEMGSPRLFERLMPAPGRELTDSLVLWLPL